MAFLDVVRAWSAAGLSTSEGLLLVIQNAALVLMLGAPVGAIQATAARALARRTRKGRVLAATLPASLVLSTLGAILVVERWPVLSPVARAAAMAGLLALQPTIFVVALGLRRVETFWSDGRRSRGARLTVAALLVCVVLVHTADRFVLPRLYPRAHDALVFIAFCLAHTGAAGIIALLPGSRRRTRVILLSLAAPLVGVGLVLLANLGRSAPLAIAALDHTALEGRVIRVVRAAFDSDQDGYSRVLGGGDCDDTDPRRHPGALELPENDVDDDCSGHDLRLEDLQHLQGPVSSERSLRKLNVLLITIDSLRADHIGVYGYGRGTTPAIDALARESMWFLRAYAQSNATAASLPSLLTGRYPSTSPWSFDHPACPAPGWPYLTDVANVTLAELLQRAGYETEASDQGRVIAALGLDQGFGQTTTASSSPGGDLTVFLGGIGTRPWFYWTHFDGPHLPYLQQPGLDFGDRDVDLYDGEIAATDVAIGDVIAQLKRYGMYDSTIVILTADHGEEFWDHGGIAHGSTLYEEQIRVPLIVRIPGSAPSAVHRIAELVDVVPMVLKVLGLPRPPQLDGHDLRRLRKRAPGPPTLAYTEQYVGGRVLQAAVIDARYKLILDRRTALYRLYDLETDPHERRSLPVPQHPEWKRLSAGLGAVPFRHELWLLARARRGEGDALRQLARGLELFEHPALFVEALKLLEDAKEPEDLAIAVAELESVIERSKIAPPFEQKARGAVARLRRRLSYVGGTSSAIVPRTRNP